MRVKAVGLAAPWSTAQMRSDMSERGRSGQSLHGSDSAGQWPLACKLSGKLKAHFLARTEFSVPTISKDICVRINPTP